MATSFCPDQPEVRAASATRSTLQPEVAATGSLAKAVGAAHEGGYEQGTRGGSNRGRGSADGPLLAGKKMRKDHAIPC